MLPDRTRSLVAALALAAAAVAAPRPASAVELLYTWKVGDVHRFRLEEHTKMQLAGMAGMTMAGVPGADMTAHVTTTFSEKVLRVRPDGTAEIELLVEDLQIAQGSGKPVAALALLPAAARKVKAEVDRKGNARFYRIITVYQVENRFVVGGRASVDRGRVSASAGATTPDGERVEVYGSIDVRTGRVTAGAKVSAAAEPAKVAVKVRAEDPAIEVVPRQIFELLVLPSGDIAPGTSVEIPNPLGRIRVTCEALDGSVAPLRFATVASVATPPAGGRPTRAVPPADPDGDDGTDGVGMPGGGEMPGMGGMPGGGEMPGMGGMPGGGGMPGMGGMPGGGGMPGTPGTGGEGVTTAMKLTMDVRSRFDIVAGRLLEVEGRMITAMGAGDGAGMGGGVKIESDVALQRLPQR